jgi:hypothetical protein
MLAIAEHFGKISLELAAVVGRAAISNRRFSLTHYNFARG